MWYKAIVISFWLVLLPFRIEAGEPTDTLRDDKITFNLQDCDSVFTWVSIGMAEGPYPDTSWGWYRPCDPGGHLYRKPVEPFRITVSGHTFEPVLDSVAVYDSCHRYIKDSVFLDWREVDESAELPELRNQRVGHQ